MLTSSETAPTGLEALEAPCEFQAHRLSSSVVRLVPAAADRARQNPGGWEPLRKFRRDERHIPNGGFIAVDPDATVLGAAGLRGRPRRRRCTCQLGVHGGYRLRRQLV